MPDSATDEALRRYRIIRPFLLENVSLAGIARHQGLSVRILRLWVRRYRSRGIAGLSRQPRSDKGSPRALSPEERDLTEALALETPPRTAAAIWRTITAVTREKNEHQKNGESQTEKGRENRPPSYRTVRRIVRAIDPPLLSLAHLGSKAYGERYDLLYRREATAPNAMWQADHTLLDILVLDDKGKPEKPWLTVIIDDYSRAVAGYFLSRSVRAADCPGTPPGDLAQGRTGLADLRHPGCPLYRQRQ